MDQQHCDVCAEKQHLRNQQQHQPLTFQQPPSKVLDAQALRPLIDAYGINKLYLRELCAEAQVITLYIL